MDYSLSIMEVIEVCRFDFPDVHRPFFENFVSKKKGEMDLKFHLISFDYAISTTEVEEYLEVMNLRSAFLPELLAFGMEFWSKPQINYPIWALGSRWAVSDRDDRVLFLSRDYAGRRIGYGFHKSGYKWNAHYDLFLAVEK